MILAALISAAAFIGKMALFILSSLCVVAVFLFWVGRAAIKRILHPRA